MEYTAQQAAEAARNIGVDLEGEKIRPEALAAGMAVEAARHGTKDAATNIVAEDPVIAGEARAGKPARLAELLLSQGGSYRMGEIPRPRGEAAGPEDRVQDPAFQRGRL